MDVGPASTRDEVDSSVDGVGNVEKETTVYHDARERDSESSNNDGFATPKDGNATGFDSILSEDDSLSRLNNLPTVNLMDRFARQMESDGSTEPGYLSPVLSLSPVVHSRSPTRSRSPRRVSVRDNPTPVSGAMAEKAIEGEVVVKTEMDDDDELDFDEPDDVRNFSTKARKGSSANPSPPRSSTPTAALSRELRRLRDFNKPGLEEAKGLGRGRSGKRH